MKDEIWFFIQTNPWSAAFTGLILFSAIFAILRSLIARDGMRAFVITLWITLLGFIYTFIGIPEIGQWLDADYNHVNGIGDHALIYFIGLIVLGSITDRLYEFKNKNRKGSAKEEKRSKQNTEMPPMTNSQKVEAEEIPYEEVPLKKQ